MDGSSRAFGVGPTIQLRGKTYTVNGRIFRHYAEIEAEVIRLRGNPFEMIPQARDVLSGELATLSFVLREIFNEARRWRFLSHADFHEFLDSWRGEVMQLWMAIRHNDPELTLDAVMEMFGDEVENITRTKGVKESLEWRDKVSEAIAQASGEDPLGNSTGSVPTPPEPNEPTTATPPS